MRKQSIAKKKDPLDVEVLQARNVPPSFVSTPYSRERRKSACCRSPARDGDVRVLISIKLSLAEAQRIKFPRVFESTFSKYTTPSNPLRNERDIINEPPVGFVPPKRIVERFDFKSARVGVFMIIPRI